MSVVISKGYIFGSTELVTNTKLHTLVDSATVSGAVVTSELVFYGDDIVSYGDEVVSYS